MGERKIFLFAVLQNKISVTGFVTFDRIFYNCNIINFCNSVSTHICGLMKPSAF